MNEISVYDMDGKITCVYKSVRHKSSGVPLSHDLDTRADTGGLHLLCRRGAVDGTGSVPWRAWRSTGRRRHGRRLVWQAMSSRPARSVAPFTPVLLFFLLFFLIVVAFTMVVL